MGYVAVVSVSGTLRGGLGFKWWGKLGFENGTGAGGGGGLNVFGNLLV